MIDPTPFSKAILSRLVSSKVFDPPAAARAVRLAEDAGWAAALTILTFRHLAAKTRPFISVERCSLEVEALLAASRRWSSGERLLVDAAVSLYCGGAKLDLSNLMGTLNGEWADALIAGMLAYQKRILRETTTSRP
jgi:hypothetical protein